MSASRCGEFLAGSQLKVGIKIGGKLYVKIHTSVVVCVDVWVVGGVGEVANCVIPEIFLL